MTLSGGHVRLTAQAFVEAITGGPPAGDADDSAEALRRWLMRRQPVLPPLILADELDDLALRIENRFLQRLRGFVGDAAIVLVTATKRHLSELCANGQSSPFDHVLETHHLGLLDPDEAEALISFQAGLFDEDDRALSLRFSGCHPYFLELLANHLIVARREGRAKALAVEACYAEAAHQIRWWWEHLKEKERVALSDVCHGRPPAPKPRMSLQGRGLLDPQGEPFGEVLSRWILELSC